jgi:hypothetical protein
LDIKQIRSKCIESITNFDIKKELSEFTKMKKEEVKLKSDSSFIHSKLDTNNKHPFKAQYPCMK